MILDTSSAVKFGLNLVERCALYPNEVLGREPSSSRSSAPAIDSSNKGFQGRLEPVETHMKNNKHGLGADKVKKKIPKTSNAAASDGKDGNEKLQSKKSKALSKKARKMLELEKQLQDKEFERAFFREFWPENV
ncbi:hypothetical protein CDL15_Pgr008021 [Punica granatum]|uniref:Uncharacterized protein n=1 Tax=Punica granatum TaxID=22663 RepID=A0A218VRH7_PUNGR|nr:hypothetical protein CDL15_Pgr008021 [Punica granatum]